jgi:hypothetical protein
MDSISNFFVAYFISIAMGCIYTEAKNYPREPASHVAISKFFLPLFTLSLLVLWNLSYHPMHE